ncbi:unnamed protein product [Sphenostylis stenocarpa]|uniref:Cytochrome b561 domain-containing protein n=1 Tax=Sphenostylis stenocarpa TaxID=92480 RepID=A0AA86S4C2_9FABA|nr:unnamed protein product [Sphenostylis stenocarpa]
MTLSCLIILLGLFIPFHPIHAQFSSCNELSHVKKIIFFEFDTKINENYKDEGHILTRESQRHFQNVYGILILIGWGTLLPIGVMTARYMRHFPPFVDVWFKCHIVCQTLGYILGTVGWSIWLYLGMSSKLLVSKTQSILSIIAFTFINLQMLGTVVRLQKEVWYCKCWNICHHLLGYAIIGIVIVNIFAVLQAETLKRVYVGILVVFSVVVVPLEIYRCKFKILLHVAMINHELWNREGS